MAGHGISTTQKKYIDERGRIKHKKKSKSQ